VRAIRAGEFIVEYTGRHVTNEEADRMTTRYLFELNDHWAIDGSARSNTARYINHSCDPNCEAEVEDGRVLISAARDIVKGEELTYDYGEEYFDEFIRLKGCRCTKCQSVTPSAAVTKAPTP
jgi:SET domain-containing protein